MLTLNRSKIGATLVHVKGERDSVMDGRLRLVAMIAVMLLMQSPVWGAPLPKPTYTNKTKFRIPYKFDPAALERMNAREVQLHVSRDHGANWSLTQSLEPDGGKFVYESPAEGEYWFAVKTLDGRNQLHPPRGSYETGLIVVVDTTPPQLDLTLQQVGAGKANISWQTSDSNLAASTLQLEFQTSNSRDWEMIRTDSLPTGQSTWEVPSGVVSVRGTVADTAGNIATAKAQIEVGATTERGMKSRPSLKGPIATTSPDDDIFGATSKNSITALPDPIAGEKGYRGPVITPQGTLPTYSGIAEPFASTTRTDGNHEFVAAKTGPPEINNAVAGPNSAFDTQLQFGPRPSPAREQAPTSRRASSRQRVVTSRRFQVSYAVEDVGPSGIAAVELFITEDNGRKWWKLPDDPDQKSPFDVEVPRDGEYGFSIRVRSGAGLSNEPPTPGEAPMYSVMVDQTPPVIDLLPIQQGTGSNINRLRIRWRIAEEHPSDKPVSLYYSANRNGPWEPITGWKEDRNGMFDWTVGVGVPVQFYIRVMARDTAGNIATAETPQPIIVDLSRPTAQIIDIESPEGIGPQ